MREIPKAHFVGQDEDINWRSRLASENDIDNDEELDETPQDVIGMLGFDPKESSIGEE